jgi:hypothetical protein
MPEKWKYGTNTTFSILLLGTSILLALTNLFFWLISDRLNKEVDLQSLQYLGSKSRDVRS